MKRCDNCGWYNNDSLSVCEKCGEPLGSYLEPEPSNEHSEDAEVSFSPASPFMETEPKTVVPEGSISNKTLRVGEGLAHEKTKKTFSATVRDVGSVMDGLEGGKVKNCPKCHYPLAGDSDTCPNCGEPLPHRTTKDAARFNATIREGMAPLKPSAPIPADVGPEPHVAKSPTAAGKATMRDIPKELLQNRSATVAPIQDNTQEIFRLVPVAGTEGPSVYMRVGDLVQIGNKRFRFVK